MSAIVSAVGQAEAFVERVLRLHRSSLVVISGGVGQREWHAGPGGQVLVLGHRAAAFEVQSSCIFNCADVNRVRVGLRRSVENGRLLALLSETLIFELDLV